MRFAIRRGEEQPKFWVDQVARAAISSADKARLYTKTSSTIPLIGVPVELPMRRGLDEDDSRSAMANGVASKMPFT